VRDSRRRTADRFQQLAKLGQIVIAIGDAVAAGKSKEAIASTFEAALVPWLLAPRNLFDLPYLASLHSVASRSATAMATILVAARKSLSRRFSFALCAFASPIERGPAP
jgi:hypothetical protein